MAPLPKNSITHFTHPGHPLKTIEDNQEYRCDGCKTVGSGKRYRCHACNFNIHEYCGTCPMQLSSFMHNHSLTLVMRKQQGVRQVERICDVCEDPVEGLFYRCKDCEFDVHPLCTQLPQQLQHALHKAHPLCLESTVPGECVVCRKVSDGWRYRCRSCNFDIHLECVLVPTVQLPQPEMTSRSVPRFNQGTPFQPQYHYANPYGHYGQYGQHFGPNPNMYYNPQMYYQNFMPQQTQVTTTGNGKMGKSMFALVGQLGAGVLSNMIFGMDFTSFF